MILHHESRKNYFSAYRQNNKILYVENPKVMIISKIVECKDLGCVQLHRKHYRVNESK